VILRANQKSRDKNGAAKREAHKTGKEGEGKKREERRPSTKARMLS